MIYCVEDDGAILNLMVYTLNASGMNARGFADGEAFFAALGEQLPELVVLDIMLPGMDGLQILEKLKRVQETEDIPVIVASAKGTEFDKVRGLDLGADDYLAKPFGMMEMVSRVRAVLRRTAPKTERLLRLGQLLLDEQRHRVESFGQAVQLTVKEFDLLKLLMQTQGRVCTREELMLKVWGTDYMGETRTVDVHIGNLRTKLGQAGEYIHTVRGVGYRIEETP